MIRRLTSFPLVVFLTSIGCSSAPPAPDVSADPAPPSAALRGPTESARPGDRLENTYWKLVRLGDTPVAAAPGQREPHLIINSETRRASGYGGCNRYTGGYHLQGESLRLGPLAATQMACVQGMQTEQAFLPALDRVRGWRIVGSRLELLDDSGLMVARFEAVRVN